jgi:hypothetical protein
MPRDLLAEKAKATGRTPRDLLAPKESDLRGGGVGSFLTSIPEGIPIVGPYVLGGLQRAGAYGRSLQSGQPFEEELKTVQGMTEEAQAEHPYLSTAGHVAGAAGSLVPLAATGPGAVALGLRGSTLIGRGAAGAGTMGAIGATDAAVRSGGDPYETAKGGAFGAAGGLAGPYIGASVGAGVRELGRVTTLPGAPLSSVTRGAANYAANAAPSAGQVAELQRLGPHATLADVSPEWMGVARGAAARPGNRDAIVQALLDRQAGANQRLGQDLDTSLGSVRNPGHTEAYLRSSREALGPQYEQALQGSRAVDTQGVANSLDALAVDLRGPEQQAVQQVRSYLNIPGQQVLDPSPRALLATRQAIDGMMSSETNRSVIRQLTIARQQIDAEIERAVPGIKDVDAQFAELSRQSGGLQRGSEVLDSGKQALRPEDLAAEMQQGALPQGTQVGPSAVPQRIREGARAEIDRVAGTSANDPVALQRLVKGEGDWNRDKLRTLFGPQADDALNAIDRETIFNRTTNRVTGGSDTAMANQFAEFLNRAAEGPNIPHDLSVLGAMLLGGKAALGLGAAARSARYASQLGRASVATGADRDALIAAIQDYARRRALGQPVSDTPARLAQYGLSGSLAPLRDRGAR